MSKDKEVKFTITHRRCTRCHTKPEKKGERHKLYLFKGFHLCEACYAHAKEVGA